MGFNSNKHTLKFTKTILLALIFALYFVILWFSFSSKGIYLDGHFYKKSANLTTVTYTCNSPFAQYKKIILEKQVDKTEITIDSSHTITIDNDGNWRQTGGDALPGNVNWSAIAQQQTETTRGSAKKQQYIIVSACYIAFAVSKFYSTKVYEFLFKNKAAGENYYRVFNIVFAVVTVIVMIYFLLP